MSLNPNQELLTNELERNMILLASASTGKTNTLSKRVANIINMKKSRTLRATMYNFTNKLVKK